MSEKKSKEYGSPETSDLRRKAEQQMHSGIHVPAPIVSESDARALVHELQVHQIELEMQNEELWRAQAAAAEASERYHGLFDFAPVGYFLWDQQGRIHEVNLAGAALLGQDRGAVVQKRFGQFLAMEDRDRFADYCHQVLASDSKQTCEFRVLRDGQATEVLIEGIGSQERQGQEKVCRAAVIDITQRKRAETLAAANQALETEIAARKRAEESLRRSEEHFRALAEALPQIVWTADAKGAVDWFNHRWYDYTGQEFGGGEGWSWQSVAHPDDIPRTIERWQQAIQSASIFENEIRVRRSDGAFRWFLVRAWPLPNSNGEVVRWFGTNTDIQDLKAAQEALSISEARLRLAQQAAHVGTFEWDMQKDVNTWTPELDAMYGLPVGGFAGTQKAWEDLVHADDRAAAVAHVEEAFRTGAPTEGEWRVIWPDGSLHWLSGRWQVFRDEAGRPLRMTGVNIDITERKLAEESLRQMNESLERRVAERTADLNESMNRVHAVQHRLHEVLDSLPVYVILLTPEYHVSFANRYFEDRFGKSDGRRCYEYLFNRAEPCEPCETYKVLKSNAPHQWEWTGPDDRIYDINDFPFTDVDGSRLILEVGMDITLRRRNEKELAAQSTEVQRLANQLRALAVDLSQAEQRERKRLSKILHDHIQQLLVAARMQVEWLKRDTNTERMHSTAQGVVSILGEALDASRSLTVELSPPVLHEAGLIASLGWLASRMSEKHHLKVNLSSDSSAEPADEATRFLLFDCARELLFNAVKHAGVSEAHVALLRTTDERIRLIIRDEGRGFDPGLLQQRGADEATFGLFSIQQRLAHLGGELEIIAAPDRGTSIHVVIPAGKPDTMAERLDRAAAPAKAAGSLPVRGRALAHRVLVVDDHRIVREGLMGLLQTEPDIEIAGQAADGPQAIELAEQLQPDVVIMDVNLPGMSGVEATKYILERNPNTRVIGLSMHTDENLVNALLEAGAVAYLTKGGPSNDLIAAIRKYAFR